MALRTKVIIIGLFLLGIFAAPHAEAAIAFVQASSSNCGSVTNCSLTFPSPGTAGGFYAVTINFGAMNVTTSIVTSTQGDTFAQSVSQNQTTQGNSEQTWYAMNAVGGTTTTINIHISGAAKTIRASIAEFSGVATTSAFDTATSSQGAASPSNSGNITTATSTELLIGGYSNSNNGSTSTFTPGNSFLAGSTTTCPTTICQAMIYRITVAPLTVSATITYAVGANWTQTISAFLPPTTVSAATNYDPFMMADNF